MLLYFFWNIPDNNPTVFEFIETQRWLHCYDVRDNGKKDVTMTTCLFQRYALCWSSKFDSTLIYFPNADEVHILPNL